VRDGDKRVVNIQEGNPSDKTIVIVDDLVQTGGTLYECGLVLKAQGAKVNGSVYE
jgi:predicted amidophosphoribosyltransferase